MIYVVYVRQDGEWVRNSAYPTRQAAQNKLNSLKESYAEEDLKIEEEQS